MNAAALRRARSVVAFAILAGPAAAAETGGCARFAWDLAHERALLEGAAPVGSGALASDLPSAVTLSLSDKAALPRAPGKPSRREGVFAGHVTATVRQPGIYRVTLTGEAWIDAVQEDTERPATAFSGVADCPGIRKSVKFNFQAGPLLLQVSGASGDRIGVAITPDR